ncbi:MAG: elongation factor P [Planctomycetes bacterium]|nr:elongation factor P [Planctomycetota bacterium]
MYDIAELKKGVIVDWDEAPHQVETVTSSSPQARGASMIYKVRLRNLKTKQKVDKSFRSGDTFRVPDFQRRPVQFLYRDQDTFHFMDQASYEQFHFDRSDLEWEVKFLKDELEGIVSLVYNDEVIGLEIPPTVVLSIVETAPGIRGNSATKREKPATLETGHVVQVPEYMTTGELVSVDTRSGAFLGRASK